MTKLILVNIEKSSIEESMVLTKEDSAKSKLMCPYILTQNFCQTLLVFEMFKNIISIFLNIKLQLEIYTLTTHSKDDLILAYSSNNHGRGMNPRP
jgi:hypothetical protein